MTPTSAESSSNPTIPLPSSKTRSSETTPTSSAANDPAVVPLNQNAYTRGLSRDQIRRSTRLRMRKMEELVEEGRLSWQEIAGACGYRSAKKAREAFTRWMARRKPTHRDRNLIWWEGAYAYNRGCALGEQIANDERSPQALKAWMDAEAARAAHWGVGKKEAVAVPAVVLSESQLMQLAAAAGLGVIMGQELAERGPCAQQGSKEVPVLPAGPPASPPSR